MEKTKAWAKSVSARLSGGKKMDGPRSAVVLMVSSLTFMFQMGFLTGFGVFTVKLKEAFSVTLAEAALAGGLCSGVLSCSAVFAVFFYSLLGLRLTMLLGMGTATLGLLSASFATRIAECYVSLVIVGFGFGLNLQVCMNAQVEYWSHYRPFAMSAISIGGGLGTTLAQQLFVPLFQSYGWRSSLLVFAGIISVGHFGAMLVASRRPKRYDTPFREMFCVDLFRQTNFYLILLIGFSWGGSALVFFFFTNEIILNTGLSNEDAAAVMLVLGIVNTVARVPTALCVQLSCTNRPLLNAAANFLVGVGIIAFAFPSALAGFYATAVVFGVGIGILIASNVPMILGIVGGEKLAAANGMNGSVLGLGTMAMPYAAGALRDQLGLRAALGLLTTLAFIASAGGILIAFLARRKEKRQAK